MADYTPMRLLAQSPEDLEVLSAALQDAVGLLGDFQYEPKAHQFTLVLNRFRWEGPKRGHGERVRAALQVGSVLKAQGKRLKQGHEDGVISLLSMAFEPAEAPGGVLSFTFSGGGELRLEVECLDMAFADVSEPWRAAARPSHPDDDEA